MFLFQVAVPVLNCLIPKKPSNAWLQPSLWLADAQPVDPALSRETEYPSQWEVAPERCSVAVVVWRRHSQPQWLSWAWGERGLCSSQRATEHNYRQAACSLTSRLRSTDTFVRAGKAANGACCRLPPSGHSCSASWSFHASLSRLIIVSVPRVLVPSPPSSSTC